LRVYARILERFRFFLYIKKNNKWDFPYLQY
jgi:hypothetical protein